MLHMYCMQLQVLPLRSTVYECDVGPLLSISNLSTLWSSAQT
jgi:hypothetical protein